MECRGGEAGMVSDPDQHKRYPKSSGQDDESSEATARCMSGEGMPYSLYGTSIYSPNPSGLIVKAGCIPGFGRILSFHHG